MYLCLQLAGQCCHVAVRRSQSRDVATESEQHLISDLLRSDAMPKNINLVAMGLVVLPPRCWCGLCRSIRRREPGGALHDSHSLAQTITQYPACGRPTSYNNIWPISQRSGETSPSRVDVATSKVGEILDDRGLQQLYVIDSHVFKMGTRIVRVVLGIVRINTRSRPRLTYPVDRLSHDNHISSSSPSLWHPWQPTRALLS
jgi:hypothetical protein